MVTVKLPDPSFVWTVASGRRFRLQSSQADFREMLHAWLRPAIWLTLVTVLEEEVTAFIGAPRCGRTASQRDERNGDYKRDLMTTAGNAEQLPVPRTRGAFRTQVFERYQRRQAKLETAISEKFVFGASTTRVGEVVERLTMCIQTPRPSRESFTRWKSSSQLGRPAVGRPLRLCQCGWHVFHGQ